MVKDPTAYTKLIKHPFNSGIKFDGKKRAFYHTFQGKTMKGLHRVVRKYANNWKGKFIWGSSSRDIGSRVDSELKYYSKAKKIKPTFHKYTKKIVEYLEKIGIVQLQAQWPIYNPVTYVATAIDLFGYSKTGETYLFEVKTGYDYTWTQYSGKMLEPFEDVNNTIGHQAEFQLGFEDEVLKNLYHVTFDHVQLIWISKKKGLQIIEGKSSVRSSATKIDALLNAR